MAFGGRSQLKMSEETFDFVCTACADDNKTVEAVKYCVECSGYCCQPCTDVHKKFPALKSHNLMDITQGHQASGQKSSLLELPTERCSIHKAKVVDMYCESCDAVGCYVCIAKDHKSCQDSDIHSIPDMIDTLFKLSDCKQAHSLLKDMMVSITTVSKSKDTQLQSLYKAKNEALDKVMIFQKALEAIVRKAAESSRQEVEAVFKQRETEILNDQQTVDVISENLKSTNEKLNKSGENRAQRFVSWKIAQEKMKEADKEKIKQELQPYTDVQISFVPDHSLLEHIQALQGIGRVQKQATQKKHDLYKVKGSRDITIKLHEDSHTCTSFGCCLTQDVQLLVTDNTNKKLKRIDIQKMSVVDYCTLDSNPCGVCCISKHEVAVACEDDNKIQFVSIQNTMTPAKQLKMSHRCYGIAFNADKLYVTDGSRSLYIYDLSGSLLKNVSPHRAGKFPFAGDEIRHVTSSTSKLFIGTGDIAGLTYLDGMGNHLLSTDTTILNYADGVSVDGRGNVFVTGFRSKNVVQFSEKGRKVGVVKINGLRGPRAVCFHPGTNRMFVTLHGSNELKMFELV